MVAARQPYIPAPRNITDELLEQLLTSANEAVVMGSTNGVNVTLTPSAWLACQADARDLALDLKRIRRQVAHAGGLAPPRSGAVNRRDVDWPVLVELVKLGVSPDQLERTYAAALDIAQRLELPTEHAAVVVGRVLALFGTPSVAGVEAEGYRA